MFTPSIPVSVCPFFFAHAALHLALLLSSLCSYATGEQEGRRTKNLPNFIVILADDLAWDDIGAFGNTKVHTPNLDQLASQGMCFDQAFLTSSSCSPSRASILTGLSLIHI